MCSVSIMCVEPVDLCQQRLQKGIFPGQEIVSQGKTSVKQQIIIFTFRFVYVLNKQDITHSFVEIRRCW